MGKNTVKNKQENEFRDINSRLMDLVVVENLNPTIFVLKIEKDREYVFKGQESKAILIKDIISIASNTKAFTGVNGAGKSSPLYIHDRDVRIRLGFEQEDGEGQDILNESRVLEILNMKFKDFKDIAKEIFNDIPKKALLEKVVINNDDIEAKKIKFIENELNLTINYPEE